VTADRLSADSTYSAFYYETGDCSGPEDAVGSLRMDAQGRGEMDVRIGDDLEDLGSVSVWAGEPEEARLVACATLR
jgi:hypothetical protein